MSTKVELTHEVERAIKILKSRLDTTFDCEVTVDLLEPRIEIATFMNHLEVVIQLGSYKKITMVSMADLSQVLLVDNVFHNIYVNFVYQFIKDAAKRY